MKKHKTLFVMLLLLLNVLSVNADSGQFINNFIPDSVTKSLQGMQIFYYEFMAFVLDVFTILLFVVWILSIFGIIYVVYYLVSLPKRMGVKNYHDAIIKLATSLWDFMA